jgi:hypothetical protein
VRWVGVSNSLFDGRGGSLQFLAPMLPAMPLMVWATAPRAGGLLLPELADLLCCISLALPEFQQEIAIEMMITCDTFESITRSIPSR